MICLNCSKFSLKAICDSCKNSYLKPKITYREVGNLEVISFFEYLAISDFIKSKYKINGYRIYKYFAKEFFAPFIKSYKSNINTPIYLIGVDEDIQRGFSNVAILTHFASKLSDTKALHNSLIAKNRVIYAGKSLEFRLNNPRNFKYNGLSDIEAILIDDVVTTGLTLQEANRILKKSGVNIHFALTLANAKDGIDY